MSETENAGASLLPVSFAIGVAVLFVGLVVNLQVVAPIGAAIALVAGLAWVRGSSRKRRPATALPSARVEETGAERFPRSRMLERATLGLGGLVALGAVLPAVGAAVLPAFLNQRRKAVDLGPLSNFLEGQFVLATFLSDPAMGEISRRTAYVRNNGLLGKQPSFTIMSSRCTHVGCPTQPNGPVFGQKRWALKTADGEVGLVPTTPAAGFGCPCHGSEFDTEGNRTAGPAPRALDRYQFSIRRGHLWLGDIYSVSRVQGAGAQARIHSFKRLGDGEPATGPESLLYPADPIS
ncbi:MAG TPA: Rieske 2Fe-2S domain-containing protein [Gaiellaceae bacterium]|nr:Rieske 2Fe-2S domain-containing protein [Gaiellaceae bacterium]